VPPIAQKPTNTVGFVPMYEPTNPWTTVNTNDIVSEADKRGYKLLYEPLTKSDPGEQIARMQSLIDARVDAIILRPVDAKALAPSIVAARRACIAVFTENRFVDPSQATPGRDYVTGIGADPIFQGQLMASWLIMAKHGKASILELEGTPGSSSAAGRKEGFDAQIATQPRMRIVASQSANFDRSLGHDVAKQLLVKHPDANVIYSHNDAMALGALSAIKEVGKAPGKDVIIVSVDGVKEAVQHVIDGSIAATAYNDPKFGWIAFDTIEKYRTGQAIPPKIVIRGPIIDSSNAASMIAEAP
jgi:ribose transport system substrate-binding protein